jgi:formylglycine-generating enzyme
MLPAAGITPTYYCCYYSFLMKKMRRSRRHGVALLSLLRVIFLAAALFSSSLVISVVAGINSPTIVENSSHDKDAILLQVPNEEEERHDNDDQLQHALPHPDPNQEDYPGMIYIGRMMQHDDDDYQDDATSTTGDKKKHRVGWHTDNAVRYIFGTSFDDSHRAIAEKDLAHRDNWTALLADIADRAHVPKSRDEVLRERALHGNVSAHGNNNNNKMPRPFGHVDTHPLDGGVVPPKVVRVEPFFLDATLVTNADYSQFVASTYYETEAQQFGWSFVLESFVSEKNKANVEVDPDAPHWMTVPGAYWRQPEGPGTSYKLREQHPVVHVSHRDAAEYCSWKGKRLPGEWEWEAAARWSPQRHGPSNRTLFIWGEHSDEPHPSHVVSSSNDDKDKKNWTASSADWANAAKYVNIWSPTGFPHQNDAQDGWRGTSPVRHYPPNGAGFYDLTGNVWEWMRGGKHKARIVRGASFVDSVDGSFNHAATLGARSTLHGTTTTANVGFRCAKSAQKPIEYHYQYENEYIPQVKPQLTIEHEDGKLDYLGGGGGGGGTVPTGSRSSATMDDDEDEADELDNDNNGGGTTSHRISRKKKKAVKRRERYSTEL